MSWQAVLDVIQAAREPDCTWTDAEFRALVNLAEHLNGETGQLNPSTKLLADECHQDRRHLHRLLNQLEDKKAIRRAGSAKGGRSRDGGGITRDYELLVASAPPGRSKVRHSERSSAPPGQGSSAPPRRTNLEVEPGKNLARGSGSGAGAVAARGGHAPGCPKMRAHRPDQSAPRSHCDNSWHGCLADDCYSCGTGSGRYEPRQLEAGS